MVRPSLGHMPHPIGVNTRAWVLLPMDKHAMKAIRCHLRPYGWFRLYVGSSTFKSNYMFLVIMYLEIMVTRLILKCN
jgi:hypothetical protein